MSLSYCNGTMQAQLLATIQTCAAVQRCLDESSDDNFLAHMHVTANNDNFNTCDQQREGTHIAVSNDVVLAFLPVLARSLRSATANSQDIFIFCT